jgi:DNA mismatch repair protein MSH3
VPAAKAPLNKKAPNQSLLSAQRRLKYNYRKSPVPDALSRPSAGKSVSTSDEEAAARERHEKFVKKLGRPGSIEAIKRGRYDAALRQTVTDENTDPNEDTGDDGGQEGIDEEAEEKEEGARSSLTKRFARSKSSATAAKKKAFKLTPLDQQFVDLKVANPDVLLAIEVGYKYRFFGRDAQTASRVLSNFLVPGKLNHEDLADRADQQYSKFATCSFPTAVLMYRVKKLVEHGFKVGVVRQVETAALKSVGDNKSGPFVRKLCHLYSKGTMIDDLSPASATTVGVIDEERGTNAYIMAVTEQPGSASRSSGIRNIGIVAVEPTTGDVVYDSFDDVAMLTELETRVLHLQPCEVLFVGEVSTALRKLVLKLATTAGARARVESAAAMSEVETDTFLNAHYRAAAQGDEAQQRLDFITTQLAAPVKLCLSQLIAYLRPFHLESVFDLTMHFKPFRSATAMFLHANTITSLELFRNQTDFKPAGSLFWLMDHTRTPFGSRLLRKWISAPLIDREQLELRAQAVQELMTEFGKPVERVLAAMRHMRDLERDLAKVYFGRCGPRDLYYLLVKLRQVGQCIDPANRTTGEPRELFKSEILNRLFVQLAEALEPTEALLAQISEPGAQDNDKTQFFVPGLYESIETAKAAITSAEADLTNELTAIRAATGLPKLAYMTHAGIPYLLEVDKRDLARVPLTWTKISQYRTKSRFRTPETAPLVRELDRAREQLTVEANAAYQRFLAGTNAHYLAFRSVVRALAELDCLMALAAVSSQPHYVRPEFVDAPCVDLVGLRHPMAEQQLLDRYVANDCHLSAADSPNDPSSDGPRALVLTGPNMGGKSSYVRAVALACVMAQVGCYVPAARARLGLLDAVHTRMGAYDNLMAGESTFMVELKEVADIMRRATRRSLVLLDEVGRGTGTMDGVAIGHAVLDHFVHQARALTIFVTHYQDIAKQYEPAAGRAAPAVVRNCHMGFLEAPNAAAGGTKANANNDATGGAADADAAAAATKITFLYTVEPGLAHRSYGLNVARLARLPEPVLVAAARKSRALEREVVLRRLASRSAARTNNNRDDNEQDEDLRERLIDLIKLID